MKIEVRPQATVILNAEDLGVFVERVRLACSVALGDLLALGMPSANTSTGKLLTDVLVEIEAIQREQAVAKGGLS